MPEVKEQQYVGRYARSIETGWLGKVVAVEDHPDLGRLLKMQGVNELCWNIAGGKLSDWLDDDDYQWFVPADLKFLK